MTESPAVKLACALAKQGAQLSVYDPGIGDGEHTLIPGGVRVATEVLSATTGTQAAVVMTEWTEIVEADWATVSRTMAPPTFVFDGRNALNPMNMRAASFEYRAVGRGVMPQDIPAAKGTTYAPKVVNTRGEIPSIRTA